MKKLCLLVMLSLLCGCFFSTPNSRFYLLEAEQNLKEITDKKFNIAVQDIYVPDFLSRPQIVLQKPESAQLSVSEFDRWGSDLNAMLQTAMINNLQNQMPSAVVKPLLYGSSPRYVVKINIERFGGWLGEEAYMGGNWQILSSGGRVIVEQDFSKQQKIGRSYDAFVQALSRMWGAVSQEIAYKISTLK